MESSPESGESAYNIDLTKENKLGFGTFGAVYKIKRKRDNQIFAAKIFNCPFSEMDEK